MGEPTNVKKRAGFLESLPPDWTVASLGEMVWGGKRTVDPQSTPGEEYEYYSIPAYQDSQKPVIELGVNIRSQKLIVEPGTVLFGKLNPRVHKVWLVDDGSRRRKIASTEFIPLVPLCRRIDSDFLYFLCWTDYVLSSAKELVSGSTPSRQRVDVRAFQRVPIPVPPLPEQRAIAHVLRGVQRAKEATEKVIAATRALKQSLMRHLFTYGPVPIDQADQVELKETEIGELPRNWEAARLGDVCELLMGNSPPGSSYNEHGDGVPLINGPAEYGPKHPIPVKWTTAASRICNPDDILICVRGNTAGRLNVADREYCIGRGVAAIRGAKGRALTDFLYHRLLMGSGRILEIASAGGSTFPNINKPQLRELPVPLPPMEVQRILAHQLRVLGEKVETEETRREALGSLFKSLLHNLMTGRVRVK